MQTPHRFRTKRQLWVYSGLALKTYTSGQYRFVSGQLQRAKGPAIRGLNIDHSHDLQWYQGKTETLKSRGWPQFGSRYSWLTSADHDLGYLLMSCPQIVLGRYLAVTSFDSGALVPNGDEVIAGWESRGGIAYGRKIESAEKLPHDLHDEWHLFEFPRELGNLFQGKVETVLFSLPPVPTPVELIWNVDTPATL